MRVSPVEILLFIKSSLLSGGHLSFVRRSQIRFLNEVGPERRPPVTQRRERLAAQHGTGWPSGALIEFGAADGNDFGFNTRLPDDLAGEVVPGGFAIGREMIEAGRRGRFDQPRDAGSEVARVSRRRRLIIDYS